MTDAIGFFSGVLPELDIEGAARRSQEATPVAVERALAAHEPSLEDLAALLSPAAASDYLEAMATAAHELTVRRFGRTMHMFAPLYVSNECVSTCTYCGFSRENSVVRTTLSVEQVRDEARHLTEQGIRHLLLVSGEHARIVSVDYLCEVVAALAPEVPQLSLEVQTWSGDDYARLVAAGCDGVVVYQETYHRPTYESVHLRGRKRNFLRRLDALDLAAGAGARRLGAGALLGLQPNWRFEVLALAAHARWLEREHWRSEVSVALPRLRPCAGGLTRVHDVTDRELAQAIAALRLFLPDAAIVVTTREPPGLRDGLIPLGVTHMSAGSHTEPGGYVHTDLEAEPQFEIEDHRSIGAVAEAISSSGYEPVWKDWARV